MSIWSRLFGRTKARASALHGDRTHERIDVHRGFDVHANSDIVSGYRFCATIQLRTPLRVLRRHGEIHEGLDRDQPEIAREMWEGIWVPETRTFKELGINVPESISTMASDVGPIPQDGGDYLRFLIAVRQAAEGAGTIEERRKSVAKVLSEASARKFATALNGKESVLDRLFPRFVSTVPRMPAKTAQALVKARLASPSLIQAASDNQLRSVEGIGPGLLAALRSASRESLEQASIYVDRIIR